MLKTLSFDAILEMPSWLVAVLFFTPMVLGISFYLYKTRHARSWRKGVFPPNIAFNQDYLLEAYLAIGAKLMLYDRQNLKGKTIFINEYFNRYFRNQNYPFGDSLLFSLRHPIQIETVCYWLNKHLKTEAEKSQILYFLVGLTLITGGIKERELQILKSVTKELGLSDNHLRRIIAVYISYKERSKSQHEKTKSNLSLQTFATILDIEGSITKEKIKAAYRTMAKTYHPDLFNNKPEIQQKIAKEKFIEIQNAYERLMESV